MLHKNRIVTVAAAAALAVCFAYTLPNAWAAEKEGPKSKAVALSLDSDNAVVLDADRNGMPAKSKLTPTSCYSGYSLAPVVDGVRKRQDLSWAEAAWASEEDESAHGIEIQLSKPHRGGRFQITWAYDTNGDASVSWWVSRNYVIQVKANAGDDWKTVVDVKNNQSVIGSYPLPDTAFSFIRIYQLAGGGHPSRPDLMWVGQVELTD